MYNWSMRCAVDKAVGEDLTPWHILNDRFQKMHENKCKNTENNKLNGYLKEKVNI